MRASIAVLPGDGVGPEVIAEGVKILSAIGSVFEHEFELNYESLGGNAIDHCGVSLPLKTLERCRRSDAILLGAVGGPKWDNPAAKVRPEDGLLALRKELGLFANLRPVRVFPSLIDSSPVKARLLHGVDMIVVRELTGGLYFAKPKRRWQNSKGRRGVDTLRYTEEEISRIIRVGFELAQRRKKHLTSVDKANVLETSRLWRQIADEIAPSYPGVKLDHMLVDNAASQLIQNPSSFDIIVTENTFGDILTDEAAVLSGSMGMLPSASLSAVHANGLGNFVSLGIYEPIHGSAPDIAGKGIANPIGTLLSVALMLRLSLGLHQEAEALDQAIESALMEGFRTMDIAGDQDVQSVSTFKMGDRVAQILLS